MSNLRFVVDRHYRRRQGCSTLVGVRESRSRSRLAMKMLMRIYAAPEEVARTFSRYWSKSATASLSLSARTGSYSPSRDLPTSPSVPSDTSQQPKQQVGTSTTRRSTGTHLQRLAPKDCWCSLFEVSCRMLEEREPKVKQSKAGPGGLAGGRVERRVSARRW